MDTPGPGQKIGDFQPGLNLVETENLAANFPVVLIPGTISTGLESWGTSECSRRYFRQRMWGTLTMFRAVLLDKECWSEHMKLDPETGLDPPGVKLRAAQGLDAADYFISGYWVWGKIIENLAVLGYDNNNMHLAAYDWRLAYGDLERRDQYFSKLKSTLELHLQRTGRRSVVVAHSMGANVFLYFMQWVESPLGGNAPEDWVENHVENFVSIGGTMLGVAKTLSSLLSGEQRETVQPLVSYILERFFNKRERADLFRSWSGLGSLLPKGGNRIWGNATWAPDDLPYGDNLADGTPELTDMNPARPPTFGQMLVFPTTTKHQLHNTTIEESFALLNRSTSSHFRHRLYSEYSFGVERDRDALAANSHSRPDTWSNPLESQLPRAPTLKIYCLYGVGKPTERGYYYTDGETHHHPESLQVDLDSDENGPDASLINPDIPFDDETQAALTPSVSSPPLSPLPSVYIDVSMNNPDEETESGIRTGDGDGTVPLLSLGYMCVDGWKDPRYNPAGAQIVTREYRHNPTHMIKDIRGGSDTADHVDILGNYQVISDLLRVAAGKAENVGDQIVSDIRRIARNIDLDASAEG
ncbi:Lecithin:cholesterol acyltransferase-domain-containing protein [Dimargaris cristalligena]|uniref:Lecithin:cholesterol acyltransferase-domain-containing protein n=1 Tax=Dimargaris cristalligena TaxID=215637 RepID=A0A4P9ZUI8_9FUNG|nr:Lecithin:cholesterol acyltransferase-domain-containing protein [Dimargaris cristalligena]|eukprot:RKP36260.1 Lecithin:cholesterol acyltransferase-domain-containing protein [Dimargaris cristalligena]